MKIMPRMFVTFLLCGTIGITKAQNSSNLKQVISKQNLFALSVIKTFSFNLFDIFTNKSADVNNSQENKLLADPSFKDAIEGFSKKLFKYSMLMNVEVESLTNPGLYSFIDEWYGTHYRMGGTTKKGIDCSAFTGALLSSVFSFFVPRTAKEQYQICEHIKKEDLLTGDLVFFNTKGGVSHVGVYLGNEHFVHSSSSQGVTISSLNDEYYSRKFIGGGRVNQ